MNTIHYYFGKILGRRYRLWYHKTHDNQYMWGIIRFIEDDAQANKAPFDINDYFELDGILFGDE